MENESERSFDEDVVRLGIYRCRISVSIPSSLSFVQIASEMRGCNFINCLGVGSSYLFKCPSMILESRSV